MCMPLLENQVGSLRSKKANKFAKFRENHNAWSNLIGFAPTSKFALILDWVSMLPNQAAAMQAMSQCTGAPRTWRCTTCGMSKWLPRKNLLSWSKLLLYFYLSECLHLSILHYLCANCFALWEMFKQTTLVTPVASQDQLRSAPFCMGRCVVWAMNCTTWPSGFAAWLKINGKPWQRDMTPMVVWCVITINHKSMAFSIIQYLLYENPSAMCWRDKIPKRHFT